MNHIVYMIAASGLYLTITGIQRCLKIGKAPEKVKCLVPDKEIPAYLCLTGRMFCAAGPLCIAVTVLDGIHLLPHWLTWILYGILITSGSIFICWCNKRFTGFYTLL